jgi:hypothetical protein
MIITDLPNDLFLMIITHLSPSDLILNRRVSKQFHAAFTESDLNRHMLQQHYSRAREVRRLADKSQVDWSSVFAKVSARYHYLRAGKPRSIEKFALGKSFMVPSWAKFYPVSTWQRHLQFEEKTAHFHYQDPLWTYDEGILIFPSAEFQRYVLYDLNGRNSSEIDLTSEGIIVRRIRLSESVLVVEWCEQEAYHQLNENEMVYRHFATAYDLVQDTQTGQWSTVFRSAILLFD